MSVLFYTAKNKKDAGDRLIKLAECNKGIQETRRSLAAKYASLYEGMSLSGLAPYGYTSDSALYFRGDEGENIPIIRNACHAIVDTWVSKIAALETPKPTIITTHGAWSDRRTAKALEQLVEAEHYEPQGRFPNLEQLWIHAVRIAAAATGTVAVKVVAYPNEPKLSHEIHDTLTMFFDFGELTYGDLLTVGEITWFDVDRLCEIFPGRDNEQLIRGSIEKPPEEFRAPVGSQPFITEMVALYEGWRGSTGGKLGKYCAAVRAGTLEWRDYESPRPPFVWYAVDPHLYGILGHPLTHQIYESCRRDNLILSKIDKGVSKAIQNTILVDKLKLADPASFDVSEDDKVIDMTDPSKFQMVNGQGFHPSHKDVADSHWMDAHNAAGVPELHTASKSQPGITAAIADRQVAARLNERYADAQRRYVNAVAVEDTKLIIQALREVHERGKFKKLFPGQKFLEEIDSDVLDLDDAKYRLRPAAVSGRQNTPEGRLQLAFELRQMGILSDDGFAAVQGAGYDVPEELEDRDAEIEWVENEINRWLYAPDAKMERPDFYRGPLKWMNPPRVIDKVLKALYEAQMEDLEPERMEFFLLFLSDIDAILQAQVAEQAALAAPPVDPTTGIAPPQLTAPPQLNSGPVMPPGRGGPGRMALGM